MTRNNNTSEIKCLAGEWGEIVEKSPMISPQTEYTYRKSEELASFKNTEIGAIGDFMKSNIETKNESEDEFVELQVTIERYKGDFGWRIRMKTFVEDQSGNLSEDFLDDIYDYYGIDLQSPET